MTTNVFIVPGTFGHPYENWFPWLHESLSEMGLSISVVSLPTPEGQDFNTWACILDGYRKAGILASHSIVIAHSAGCAFFAKYAFMRHLRVQSFISVAGYNNFISGNEMMDRLNEPMYFDESIAAPELLGSAYCFISPSDPYIPSEILESFANIVNGRVVSLANGGHFNSDAGFTEFEDLLKLIKSQSGVDVQ